MVRLYDMLDLRRIERRHRRECTLHGYSFSAGGRAGSSGFDPATLSLTGWWRTDFGGSPWAGVASAGSSSGRDLSEGTNPPSAGSAVNGRTPADFDGSNDRLANATTAGNYWTQTAGSIICVFNADNATTDAGATSAHTMPAFVSTTNGYIQLTFSTSGVRMCTHNGTSINSINSGASTGGWRYGWGVWDSTTLYAATDNSSFGTVSHTVSASFSTDTIRVGTNFNASAFYDGRIAEIMFLATSLTGTERTNLTSYFNARYNLSI